jgi:hypothetical protein
MNSYQVGVIGLIVGYTVAGAFIFIALESKSNQRLWQEGHEMRSRCVDLLWNITHHLNVLHYDRWRQDVDKTLLQYQHQVKIKIPKMKTFPKSCHFSSLGMCYHLNANAIQLHRT